jgi:drug/metabolite transporter (DMT)-like permease
MNWFILALFCALFTACCDALSKKTMQNTDEWVAGTAVLGIASLFLLPAFLSCNLAPITDELIFILAVTLPLEILAYYLFLSAIRMAPLSLTVPLLAFTPVMSIFSSYVILNETITLLGGLGIGLVTVGAYILNGNLVNQHPLAPIKALVSNQGSRRMLAVAMLWAVTSTLGKKGIEVYGAIPFGSLILFGVFIVFGLMMIYRYSTGIQLKNPSPAIWKMFVIAGVLMAGAEVTHFLAMSMAPVAYMISVKRLSLVFGVLLGWLFFEERNITFRLVGSSVMVLGIFFIF